MRMQLRTLRPSSPSFPSRGGATPADAPPAPPRGPARSVAPALWAAGLLLAVASEAQAQDVLYTIDGYDSGDVLGWSVADAGDVNNDGYSDVIVGAPWDDDQGTMSGTARVVSGADGTVLHELDGDWAGDLFGWSVSGAGDVNGDGWDDVIVGAPENDFAGFNAGTAVVYSGFDGTMLYRFDGDGGGDRFGWSVSGAGDVDDDGYDDLIVGAPEDDNNDLLNSGSARVFSGATGIPLFTKNGFNKEDYFGISVSEAGDVNGDGYDDVVVGAHWEDNGLVQSGTARVFRGPNGVPAYTFSGTAPHDWFGESVACAGDVNNDGHDDVIVGARYDDDNGDASGSATVFSGQNGVLLYKLLGDSPGDWFGCAVGGVGDLDGDGYDDLIVGAREDDSNGDSSGTCRLFSGKTGGTFFTLNGEHAGDEFGTSVGGGGDVNGDGVPDYVVGAPRDDNNGPASGSALVFASPAPAGTVFCFGDPGSGTPCPCGNDNDGSVPGSGCANGVFDSGARLIGTGMPSVSSDTLVLSASGLEPENSGLYFQALNDLSPGVTWGDGLRCAGGALTRLQVRLSDTAGDSSTTVSISVKGAVAPGDIRRYQCWYRTTFDPPCGVGVNEFNATNGFQVIWLP